MKVEEDAPKVEEDAPKVEEDAPKVEEDAPKVEEDAPKVEEDAPKVEEEASNGTTASGIEGVKIHDGHQGKHIEGHNNYIEGRSKLTADPHELIKLAGTGDTISGTPPAPGAKERVDFGKVIGEYIDPKTKMGTPTTKGIIHYSKAGAHIVPARP